jgi:hypothetical protein
VGLGAAAPLLAERLQLMSNASAAEALQAAEALLTETVALAQAKTDADLSSFREELSVRRRAIDPT